MDGSQPGIPGASAIFASAFQVIEEEADKGSIEVFDPELRGHFAKSFFGKLQKQAEAIAISRYCMRAGLQLTKQAIGEERLKKRGKGGGNHGCISRSSRSVANTIALCINNAMVQDKKLERSDCRMQPRSFSREVRTLLIERMTSFINSSTFSGEPLASSRLARDQTPSSGLSSGA